MLTKGQEGFRAIGIKCLLLGALLLAMSAFSFFILVISTGHAIQPNWEMIFFGMIGMFAMFGGPLGVLLLLLGLVLAMIKEEPAGGQ